MPPGGKQWPSERGAPDLNLPLCTGQRDIHVFSHSSSGFIPCPPTVPLWKKKGTRNIAGVITVFELQIWMFTYACTPASTSLKTQSICLSFLMILIFLFVFTTNVAGGTENKVCNEIVGLEISWFNFFSLSVFHSSCELALRHLLKSLLLSLLCEEGFHDSWPPEGCSLPHHFSLPSGVFTWSKRVGSEANLDMWRDSFVIKAVRNEWVLLNIALCILFSCRSRTQRREVSHMVERK